MTENTTKELSPKDAARLGQERRDNGEGGLSWSVYDQKWIGSVELPPDPKTGKRRRKRIKHADRITALELLQDLRAQVARGEIAPIQKKGMSTVGDWLNYWLEEVHKPQLRPKSYGNYRSTADNHIIPAIGKVRLDKLAPHHVRDLHKTVLGASKSGSTRTARLCHAILSKAIHDAWVEGLVRENVVLKVPKPKANPKNRGALTSEQSLTLLKSCLEHEDRMTTRIAAALMTGARQGELLGLQWDRVDLAKGEIDLEWQLQELRQKHGCGEPDKFDEYECGKKFAAYCPERYFDVPPGFVYEQLQGALCLTKPKTARSERVVPIPPQLKETLAAHYAMTEHDPNPYNLVWRQPNGNPIRPTVDSKHWKAALERAGLPHVPLHAARHTTASLLLQADVDMHIIMQVLGHSVMLTTKNYAHVPQELARKSMNTLGGLLEIGK